MFLRFKEDEEEVVEIAKKEESKIEEKITEIKEEAKEEKKSDNA